MFDILKTLISNHQILAAGVILLSMVLILRETVKSKEATIETQKAQIDLLKTRLEKGKGRVRSARRNPPRLRKVRSSQRHDSERSCRVESSKWTYTRPDAFLSEQR
jgi:hypothetical protein